MTDIEQEIQAHIQKFAKELNELVRTAAIRAVGDALGASTKRAPTRAAKASAAPAKIAKPKSQPTKGKGHGWRRSAAQLKRAQDSMTAYVEANPGELMENIAKALSSTSRALHRPMSKLIAAGAVRREGRKRASRYFPAKAAASKKTASKKTASKKTASKKTASKKRSTAKKKSSKRGSRKKVAKRGSRKRSTKTRRKAA